MSNKVPSWLKESEEDAEIKRILEEWTRKNRSEFCPKCIKTLMHLKGKRGMKILEKFIIASTMWEDEVLKGDESDRQWFEYEICRMLHGWTLDDEIRYERSRE